MKEETRLLVFNIVALNCALWFLLFGWMWFYYFNIFYVFPFALIGLVFWRLGKKSEKKKLNRITGMIYLIGLVLSISVLVFSTAFRN